MPFLPSSLPSPYGYIGVWAFPSCSSPQTRDPSPVGGSRLSRNRYFLPAALLSTHSRTPQAFLWLPLVPPQTWGTEVPRPAVFPCGMWGEQPLGLLGSQGIWQAPPVAAEPTQTVIKELMASCKGKSLGKPGRGCRSKVTRMLCLFPSPGVARDFLQGQSLQSGRCSDIVFVE